MNETATPTSTADIENLLLPLRSRLQEHPLYTSIRTLPQLRIFMGLHVFAVWDFMSLLKSLQRTLTCVDLPWVPTAWPLSRRFINEIVRGEESDERDGRPASHFEIYLDAMDDAQADTGPIRRTIEAARAGMAGFDFTVVPAAARPFVQSTFRIIREGPAAAQAAAFAFGREDAIPEMFRSLVRGLNRNTGVNLGRLLWYLERHIEVDGEDHGPIARSMVADLCGADPALWQQALDAAEESIRARLALWDAIHDAIQAEG